jgi:hypothetical protein
MLKGNMERVGIVLALVGVLTLAAPQPGSAAPLRSRSQSQESLWERVLAWLAGDQGAGIDPNGSHLSAGGGAHGRRGLVPLRGEEGAGIDPNGRHSAVAPGNPATQGATPSGDQGMGIDPDGRH